MLLEGRFVEGEERGHAGVEAAAAEAVGESGPSLRRLHLPPRGRGPGERGGFEGSNRCCCCCCCCREERGELNRSRRGAEGEEEGDQGVAGGGRGRRELLFFFFKGPFLFSTSSSTFSGSFEGIGCRGEGVCRRCYRLLFDEALEAVMKKRRERLARVKRKKKGE